MPETARTLIEINEAIAGIEEAIISLEDIAQHPNTPYPRALIEGRANMARNTMRKQLERTAAAQKEYEEKNAEKVKEAWEIRQRELKAREDKRREQEEAEAEPESEANVIEARNHLGTWTIKQLVRSMCRISRTRRWC